MGLCMCGGVVVGGVVGRLVGLRYAEPHVQTQKPQHACLLPFSQCVRVRSLCFDTFLDTMPFESALPARCAPGGRGHSGEEVEDKPLSVGRRRGWVRRGCLVATKSSLDTTPPNVCVCASFSRLSSLPSLPLHSQPHHHHQDNHEDYDPPFRRGRRCPGPPFRLCHSPPPGNAQRLDPRTTTTPKVSVPGRGTTRRARTTRYAREEISRKGRIRKCKNSPKGGSTHLVSIVSPGRLSSLVQSTHAHPFTSIDTGVAGTARACERFVRDKAVETDLVEVGFLGWLCGCGRVCRVGGG